MSGYDGPGVGWRKAPADHEVSAGVETVTWWDGRSWHYWVREEPVPPLPDDPYTIVSKKFVEQVRRNAYRAFGVES